MKSFFILAALVVPATAFGKNSRTFHLDVGYEICEGLKCRIQSIETGSRRMDLRMIRPDTFVGQETFDYEIDGQSLKASLKISSLHAHPIYRSKFTLAILNEKSIDPIATTEVSVSESDKINVVTVYGPYLKQGARTIRPHIILGASPESTSDDTF